MVKLNIDQLIRPFKWLPLTTYLEGFLLGKEEEMTENEFLLFDRIEKIKSVIGKYGEENFCISFSGGKDSTVLHYLIDMALPDNKIPRVYANTGIELNMIRDFVFDMAKTDERVFIIKPSVPIQKMLEADGYPFKSKMHSSYVKKYQFTEENTLKISDMCCMRMKEEPLQKWQKENNKPYGIVGIMREEGGRRFGAQCLAFSGKKLKNFQPLAPVTKEWEEWFITTYNIKICDIYKPPYNFDRTGCKGCPFALHLQDELNILEKFFPSERKQCEIIWKPVYDEYRRIGYRLKDNYTDESFEQLSLFDKEKKEE